MEFYSLLNIQISYFDQTPQFSLFSQVLCRDRGQPSLNATVMVTVDVVTAGDVVNMLQKVCNFDCFFYYFNSFFSAITQYFSTVFCLFSEVNKINIELYKIDIHFHVTQVFSQVLKNDVISLKAKYLIIFLAVAFALSLVTLLCFVRYHRADKSKYRNAV